MKITNTILFSIAVLISSGAQANSADKLNSAFNELCDKMEQCALEQMAQEDNLTPQMRSMIENMVEGMCKNMMDIGEVNQYAELVDPAVACIDSMTSKTCGQLQGDDFRTQECEEYERQAEAFGAK